MPELDLLTVGRVNLDLYGEPPGVPFAEVESWHPMVGGSPTNAALAAARLGVRAGVLTAVGDDLVGDWVLRALREEGVDTSFVSRKAGPHTSLALRAQVPPDHPLAFYRHDPADVQVKVADAAQAPVEACRAILVSADALARGSMPLACLSVLVRAKAPKRSVYLDLDLRDVNWDGLDAYADAVGLALGQVNVVLGTELEFAALLGLDPDSSPEEIGSAVAAAFSDRQELVVVLKRGERGVTVLCGSERTHVPAYEIDEVTSVGAGDSFAGGLIAARLEGATWEKAVGFAGACAAITVSRPGCSSGFPGRAEVDAFLARPAVGSAG